MTAMTHDELARPLSAGGSAVGAAELHGCISGALCAAAVVRPSEWAVQVLAGTAAADRIGELQAPLGELIEQTRAALAAGDMTFTPLLPPDEAALPERVAALAGWCDGFLFGIGRSGPLGPPPAAVGEILRDLVEISHAGVGGGDAGERAERDYAELVEFVRAAVQLAFEELAPRRAAAAGRPSEETR